MMNSRDFQLIALKTAIARTYRYGRIVDRDGNEITVDQIRARLSLNLPSESSAQSTDSDIDVSIESVQNISNVTIVEDHVNCDHTEPTVNVAAVTDTVTDSVESNIALVANTVTASDNISEATKQSVVGKLFQYLKDGKNGPTTT